MSTEAADRGARRKSDVSQTRVCPGGKAARA
jgi:hypothetical protein